MNIPQFKELAENELPVTFTTYSKFLKDNKTCRQISRKYINTVIDNFKNPCSEPTSAFVARVLISGEEVRIFVLDIDGFIGDAIASLKDNNLNELENLLIGPLQDMLALSSLAFGVDLGYTIKELKNSEPEVSLYNLSDGELLFSLRHGEETHPYRLSPAVKWKLDKLNRDKIFVNFSDPHSLLANIANPITVATIILNDGFGKFAVEPLSSGGHQITYVEDSKYVFTATIKTIKNVITGAVASKTPLSDLDLQDDIVEAVKLELAVKVALDTNIQLSLGEVTLVEAADVYVASYVGPDKDYTVTFDAGKAYQEESNKLNGSFKGLDFSMDLKL